MSVLVFQDSYNFIFLNSITWHFTESLVGKETSCLYSLYHLFFQSFPPSDFFFYFYSLICLNKINILMTPQHLVCHTKIYLNIPYHLTSHCYTDVNNTRLDECRDIYIFTCSQLLLEKHAGNEITI